MRRRLNDESGMTLVELVIVAAITLLLVGAGSNIFVSGLRASSNTDARLTAQENLGVALDRLEYEGRCAQTATVLSSGGGVALYLPSWCSHATGNVAWCVVAGALVRYGGSTTCAGTAQTLATSITSATPFSCIATVGVLPQLRVALRVNSSPVPGNSSSATAAITLRNAAVTTSGASSCV